MSRDHRLQQPTIIIRGAARANRAAIPSLFLWPGTNWCGIGRRAEAGNDFGSNSAVDECCQRHDQCPFVIRARTTRYHLFNWRPYPLSYCECDQTFRTCLEELKDSVPTAARIGQVYFSYARKPCFGLSLQRVCVKKNWWGTCLKKELHQVASLVEQTPLIETTPVPTETASMLQYSRI